MEKKIAIVDMIEPAKAYEHLSHPGSGGICVFTGTVRNSTASVAVDALEFEAYREMALREMAKIADEAGGKWPLNRLVMEHVTGKKTVGDAVVLVGASSAHRPACFEACRFLIDTLKERVPIWKKEFFKDKSVWVSAHP